MSSVPAIKIDFIVIQVSPSRLGLDFYVLLSLYANVSAFHIPPAFRYTHLIVTDQIPTITMADEPQDDDLAQNMMRYRGEGSSHTEG